MINTSLRKEATRGDDPSNCFCFESDDDSTEHLRLKYAKHKIAKGCISNMTICFVLIGYTFLGAVIFLTIEGGSLFFVHEEKHEVYDSLATRLVNGSSPWLEYIDEDSRTQAVENIWELTVSLNILYKDNWTRLASQEIFRFQESIIRHLSGKVNFQPVNAQNLRPAKSEWTLARAFLYSLTILTTIGYGNIYPKTSLGKIITMGYAAVGIPLLLFYLSSVGNLLSNCAKNVFSRSLCCCLCSNCGYCCYDEKKMQERERRLRKKRERKEYEQQFHNGGNQFYLGTNFKSTNLEISTVHAESKNMVTSSTSYIDTDSLSLDPSIANESSSVLAPILICLIIMILYIGGGAFVLCKLEPSWSILDGVFFCFTILSTIGFGDLLASSIFSGKTIVSPIDEVTVWFFSTYVICGLALTAMCFNILHDEIISRLKHNYVVFSYVAPKSTNDYSISPCKMTNQCNFQDEPPNATDYLPIS